MQACAHECGCLWRLEASDPQGVAVTGGCGLMVARNSVPLQEQYVLLTFAASLQRPLKILLIYFVLTYVWGHIHASMCEVRRQFVGVGVSPSSKWAAGTDLHCQAWWQASSPAAPPPRFPLCFVFVFVCYWGFEPWPCMC